MSVKIKTIALQDATSKAIKGVGKVGMVAITTAICIEAKDGYLTLSTTNNVNNIEVRVKLNNDLETQEFYACTDADVFAKLVSKTTSEFVELEVKDSCLLFSGSGVYNLSLIQDEEGNMGRIIPISVSNTQAMKLTKENLNNIINFNKLSVAKTFEEILYTNYFLNKDKCITFNNITACNSDVSFDKDFTVLLPFTLITLLSVFTEPNINVYVDSDKIKFETDMITVSGLLGEGVDTYPVNELIALFNDSTFDKSVVVNTGVLSKCLDRLSIFTNDNSSIVLNFTKDKLIITNTDSNACEEVRYTSTSTEIQDLSVTCDISDLTPVVNACPDDTLQIVFGSESGLKINIGKVQYILPFTNEESAEEN